MECSEWNVLDWTERTVDRLAEEPDWVVPLHLTLTEGGPVEEAEKGALRVKC